MSPAPPAAPALLTTSPPARLSSLDAFRGFAMFLMAAEMLGLPRVARAFPDSAFWQALAYHGEHVAWRGGSLHDLIQPSFSFMVGVAVPFSVASRLARGQSRWAMWGHACWRALLLVLLGVFLRSMNKPITNWTFEDTLSQIGLGYPLLFLLGFARNNIRWAALAALLGGYWLFFVGFPLPAADFNYAAANVSADWAHHGSGFAAHWNLNHNAAWAFDVWFLNLFPRVSPFVGNGGGYSTLSFLPTLATMLLGLIAGTWLRQASTPAAPLAADPPAASPGNARPLRVTARLVGTGLAGLALAWLLDATGICPIIKKLWTPAWVLWSGGWCFLFMAAFYHLVDERGWKRAAFPLVVIGVNSLAMYVMAETIAGFFAKALYTHFGKAPFLIFGETFAPILHGASVLLILWLILLWMHRRRLWLRL